MGHRNCILNAYLKEDVYIAIPEGFDKKPGYCWKLKKALYGLKQAPVEWHGHLCETLTGPELGFKRIAADSCVFIKHVGKHKVIIGAFVDDMLVAASNKVLAMTIKAKISLIYKLDDKGELHYFLGVELTRNLKDHTIFFCQKKYSIQLCDLFGFWDNPDGSFHSEMFPMDCPMESTIKLEGFKGLKAEPYTGPYRQKVGKLLFLSIVSRPEIALAVGKLARYNANPLVGHNLAVCRIIAYIKGTIEVGLTLGSKERCDILTYVDASLNTDPGLKAITGFIIYLNKSPVLWCSKKQVLTTTSTMESELDGIALVAPHSLWVRDVCIDISSTYKANCLIIYEDNQSTIQHVKKQQASWKTVHLARRYHWLKQQQEMKAIKLVYCPGEYMIADALTKPVPTNPFHKFAGHMVTTPSGGDPFIQGPQGSQFRSKQLGPHDWQLLLKAANNVMWAGMAERLAIAAWNSGRIGSGDWVDANEAVVSCGLANALTACRLKDLVIGSGSEAETAVDVVNEAETGDSDFEDSEIEAMEAEEACAVADLQDTFAVTDSFWVLRQ